MAAPKKAEKEQAGPKLPGVLAEMNKSMGVGTIFYLGEDVPRIRAEAIPTKSAALNKALGIGGVPKRRIVEIYGVEHGGKTNVALGIVAEAQKLGDTCAYVDPECGLSIDDARVQGVDLDKLLYSQPSSGEKALKIVEGLVVSGEVGCIVVDSVAALVPEAELAGEMGDSHIGLQARLMGQAMRKLTALVAKNNVCLIFINQLREKVGVMHGNPEVTPGGRALKFYASVRIDVRKREFIKQGNEIIGHNVYAKVVKNKVATPHKEATFRVIYGEGVDFAMEFKELGVEFGLTAMTGSWFNFIDPATGKIDQNILDENSKPLKINGVDALYQYLQDHPDFKNLLFTRFQDKLKARMMQCAVADEDDIAELTAQDVPPTPEPPSDPPAEVKGKVKQMTRPAPTPPEEVANQ